MAVFVFLFVAVPIMAFIVYKYPSISQAMERILIVVIFFVVYSVFSESWIMALVTATIVAGISYLLMLSREKRTKELLENLKND